MASTSAFPGVDFGDNAQGDERETIATASVTMVVGGAYLTSLFTVS